MPPHVLLHDVPEVSNVEGIFVILEQMHSSQLPAVASRMSPEASIEEKAAWQKVCRDNSFHPFLNQQHGSILTEDDTSFIFWSRMSLAVKPSSRKVNSNSSLLKLLMVPKVSISREGFKYKLWIQKACPVRCVTATWTAHTHCSTVVTNSTITQPPPVTTSSSTDQEFTEWEIRTHWDQGATQSASLQVGSPLLTNCTAQHTKASHWCQILLV